MQEQELGLLRMPELLAGQETKVQTPEENGAPIIFKICPANPASHLQPVGRSIPVPVPVLNCGQEAGMHVELKNGLSDVGRTLPEKPASQIQSEVWTKVPVLLGGHTIGAQNVFAVVS